MGSGDRFYLLKATDGRDALWGDIGSQINIKGLVVGTGASAMVLLLPDETPDSIGQTVVLDLEGWMDFIHRSDDPEILVGLPKVFQRKLRYAISGDVQQKIWAADGFKCAYCGREMGEVSLTVDHFDPLEHGGANDETNYISACRKCNKRKGNLTADVWCARQGLDEAELRRYLRNRRLP